MSLFDTLKAFVRQQSTAFGSWLQTPFASGLLVVMVSWGMYFSYLWPQMLYYDKNGVQAGWIGVWGDWAAHIIYSRVFAFRPPSMWFAPHPLHINSEFTYPFLADAISGWLMRAGMDVVQAFVYPSIVTSLVFLALLYGFYYFFVKKPSQAFVALSLFLLNGGVGFWWWLKDFTKDFDWQKIAYPPLEYTHLKGQPIEWISIITSEMIPQRSFLLGFPLVVMIVLALYKWQLDRFSKVKWWQVFLLGLASGSFLFIHAHSFLVLFAICVVLFFFSWRQWFKGKALGPAGKFWLTYGLSTALVALPIFLWLHAENAGSFMSWLPGWLAHPKEKNVNILYFWWLNYGLFLPVAMIGTIALKWYKNPLVVTGWVLFVLLNLVKFQPWPWDNTKVITWAHLFLVLPVFSTLLWSWRKNLSGKVLAVVLFLLLTFSSWLDVWRFTRVDQNSYQMWSYADLQIAHELNQLAEPGDRVLTGQNHNSWVAAHTETQVLFGFPGWLWTYGVTDHQLSEDMNTMFRGGPAAEDLLRQYEVKFIVIGNPERIDWRANEAYFGERFPVVARNGEYNVYATGF